MGDDVRRDKHNPPTMKGKIHGSPDNDEPGHLEFCPMCGQTFDKRNLVEVLHHHLPEHEPFAMDR